MPKKTQKSNFEEDPSFYTIANEIARQLVRNKDGSLQKDQVEELLALEIEFKESILKYSRQSTDVYKKFVQKIRVTNKNILSARPFFRESAKSFSKNVTPHLKTNNIEKLKTFDINYQLVKFIKENWIGPFPKKAEKLFKKIHTARTKLIENNLPLAVNRAKLFYRKTPKGTLTLIDLIGICSAGLAAGVDKWNGPYSPVFRSVCIGRMVGNMISDYSDTTVHFYPTDKKILYRTNSIRGRQHIEDIEELTKEVNNSWQNDINEAKKAGKRVPIVPPPSTVAELSELLAAASTVSADTTVNEEGFGIYDYYQDPGLNIENDYIEKECLSKIFELAKNFTILQKKVLRLKGLKV